MEVHPLCDLFPQMSPEEFGALRQDMAEHGQLDPIITHEGMILDGRHRYRVCLNLGMTPKFEPWSGQGGSPLAFVVSRNLHRRSLTPGQRAAIALEVKPRLEEEARVKLRKAGGDRKSAAARARKSPSEIVPNPIDSRKEAAALLGVNAHYVSDVETIRDESPEAFEAVKRGEMTIPQAKRTMHADHGQPTHRAATAKKVITKYQALNKCLTEIQILVGSVNAPDTPEQQGWGGYASVFGELTDRERLMIGNYTLGLIESLGEWIEALGRSADLGFALPAKPCDMATLLQGRYEPDELASIWESVAMSGYKSTKPKPKKEKKVRRKSNAVPAS